MVTRTSTMFYEEEETTDQKSARQQAGKNANLVKAREAKKNKLEEKNMVNNTVNIVAELPIVKQQPVLKYGSLWGDIFLIMLAHKNTNTNDAISATNASLKTLKENNYLV